MFLKNLNNDNLSLYASKLNDSYIKCMNELENIKEENGK